MHSDFILETPISTTRIVGQPGNRNNKLGKNQYKDRPLPDDPLVEAALRSYYRQGINDSNELSKLLQDEHGITLSESTVRRRKKKLGLVASRVTTRQMNEEEKRRLISAQMAKDPKGKLGARMIKQMIFEETGVHLTRDYIREEMRKLDPNSFVKRGPRHMKIRRLERLAREASGELFTASSSTPRPTAPQQKEPRFIVYNEEYQRVTSPEQEGEEKDAEGCDDDENDPCNYHEEFFHDALLSDSVSEGNGEQPQPALIRPAVIPEEISAATTMLRNALPGLHALSRHLDNIDGRNVQLDEPTYGLFLQAMGSAALLERQLSRMVSRTSST